MSGRALRALLVLWLIGYPILPFSPLVAAAIAVAVGPPFVLGVDANGWPLIGPITPAFVATTIGIPWVGGGAVLALLLSRASGSASPGNADATRGTGAANADY